MGMFREDATSDAGSARLWRLTGKVWVSTDGLPATAEKPVSAADLRRVLVLGANLVIVWTPVRCDPAWHKMNHL